MSRCDDTVREPEAQLLTARPTPFDFEWLLHLDQPGTAGSNDADVVRQALIDRRPYDVRLSDQAFGCGWYAASLRTSLSER